MHPAIPAAGGAPAEEGPLATGRRTRRLRIPVIPRMIPGSSPRLAGRTPCPGWPRNITIAVAITVITMAIHHRHHHHHQPSFRPSVREAAPPRRAPAGAHSLPNHPSGTATKVVFGASGSGGKAGGINGAGGKALPTGGMAARRQSVAA
eukprot:gene14720-biopygen2364